MAKLTSVRTVDGQTVKYTDERYDIQHTDDTIVIKDKQDGSLTTIMKKHVIVIHEEFTDG
ncbi:hypothetical protein ACFLS1_05575 [Verrucomicrobiota bacterium]